jgi:hypothetical protein
MQGSNNGDESPHCTDADADTDNQGSNRRARGLTGLKQTTLVPVALSVSYTDMTIRPAIDRAIWRMSHVVFFSVSWPIASVWMAEASRGWSGDGVDEDKDMAES